MTLGVLLMSAISAILLLAPVSEGVRCYHCRNCDNTKDPGEIIDCTAHCYEGKGTTPHGPEHSRGCSTTFKDVPSSGCIPYDADNGKVKAKVCGCKSYLCNANLFSRGYSLSYQRIIVAASLVVAVSVHEFVL